MKHTCTITLETSADDPEEVDVTFVFNPPVKKGQPSSAVESLAGRIFDAVQMFGSVTDVKINKVNP